MSTEPAIQSRAASRPDLRIPTHVGVIMDGNGRWAKARGKPRTEGHVAGVKSLRGLVEIGEEGRSGGSNHLAIRRLAARLTWRSGRNRSHAIAAIIVIAVPVKSDQPFRLAEQEQTA